MTDYLLPWPDESSGIITAFHMREGVYEEDAEQAKGSSGYAGRDRSADVLNCMLD